MKGRFKHQGRGGSRPGPWGNRSSWNSGFTSWNRDFTRLRQGLFRSRSGVIMGVCKGIANRFDRSVVFVRAIAVLLFFLSGFWPAVGLYFLAAFFINLEPVAPIHNQDEGDFYQNYSTSRTAAIRSIHTRFKTLERKILRLEDAVTSREFDWDEKL